MDISSKINYDVMPAKTEYAAKSQVAKPQVTGENLKAEQVSAEESVKSIGNYEVTTVHMSQEGQSLSDIVKGDKETALSTEDMQAQQERVRKAIETANKKIVSPTIELNFSVHEATNRICIQVKNKETGDTIREIPSEKVLDMVADLCEIAGKIVDVKR